MLQSHQHANDNKTTELSSVGQKTEQAVLPQSPGNPAAPLTAPQLIQLQKSLGNRAVMQLMKSRLAHTRLAAQKQKDTEMPIIQTSTEANQPVIQREQASRLIRGLRRDAQREGRWLDNYEAELTGVIEKIGSETQVEDINDLIQKYLVATGETIERNFTAQVLIYMHTGTSSPPGQSGISNLHADADTGELGGRPDFSRKRQAAMPLKPGQHRRHITAWHNIRAFINKAYEALGDDFIEILHLALDNADQDISAEGEEAIDAAPRATKGKVEADGKVMMQAAYVMNSAARNLWAGDGNENSNINTLSHLLQEWVRGAAPDNLAAFHDAINAYNFPETKPQACIRSVSAKIKAAQAALTATPGNAAAIIDRLQQDIYDTDIRMLEVDRDEPAAREDYHDVVYLCVFGDLPITKELATDVVSFFIFE